jgi:hypothetical protein
MTGGKLITTWIVVGFMFVIATLVTHHFFLNIAQEMRSGSVNIEESLVKSNEEFHKVYLDQTKRVIDMLITGQIRDKDTLKLMESLEQKLTDVSIWTSKIQEKVDRQSGKLDE